MPRARFEPTTARMTVQCIFPYDNEHMANCLNISNEELNSSGFKPDLSIEIYVYNLMFWAWLQKKFLSQEVELRK
jgi:hypothetical protein